MPNAAWPLPTFFIILVSISLVLLAFLPLRMPLNQNSKHKLKIPLILLNFWLPSRMEDGKLLKKILLYSSLKLLELTTSTSFQISKLPLTLRMRKVSNSNNNKKIKKEMTNITVMFPKSLSASQRLDLKRLLSSTLLSLKASKSLILASQQITKRPRKLDSTSSPPTFILAPRWRLYPKSFTKPFTDLLKRSWVSTTKFWKISAIIVWIRSNTSTSNG